MTKLLMIHPEKCTGCENCVLACSFHHEKDFRPAATRIHVFTWEREGISVPMMCQQCGDAPCIKVCPNRRHAPHDRRQRCGLGLEEVYPMPYVYASMSFW